MGPKIAGKVVGETYTSAQQDYSVPFPVDPGMGGRVVGDSTNDNDNGVTFQDDLGSRVSFYALPFDVNSDWAKSLQIEGREKPLNWFLGKLYGSSITIHYHPEIRDGTSSFLFVKNEPDRKDPMVKASAAAFIRGNRIYIAETDLPTATTILWKNQPDESEQKHDEWLENRAVELVQTIQIK